MDHRIEPRRVQRVPGQGFLAAHRRDIEDLDVQSEDDVQPFDTRLLCRHTAGRGRDTRLADGLRHVKDHAQNPETYGKGHINGVVAPECANHAASAGSMLPMLTLGIPGSPTTAILLGGMVIWGLEPGPRLFVDHQEFVWGLIASLYVANLVAVLVNIAFIPMFVRVLKMPFTILVPIIFILCVVGGYAPTQDMHDVWLMFGFGVGGYLMRKLDYPMAPAVLAIVLGPLAETSMRQSLLLAQGDPAIFVTRPISGTIIAIAALLFLLPVLKALKKRRSRAADQSISR
ncbi:MAG: tripartite tricarboxylate transporter permease [Thiohalocapsa sp.]